MGKLQRLLLPAACLLLLLAVLFLLFRRKAALDRPGKGNKSALRSVSCEVTGGMEGILDCVTLEVDPKRPQKVTVTVRTREYAGAREKKRTKRVDPACATEAEAIVMKYGMTAWNGLPESEEQVLDAPTTSLSIVYLNGDSIYSSDSRKLPENWYAGFAELRDCLLSYYG